MNAFQPVISGYFLKFVFWRILGKVLFGHTLAFEAMPLHQAISMLGITLSFTHSKKFYTLTYAYEWRNFCVKQEPVIRLGIIGGTAQSASVFMMSQKKHPHVELRAVASRTMHTGIACARKYGISRVYSPYEQLLTDSSVEAVIVFSPISTHEKLIMQILEAGKHCIVIPPMAANTQQVKRILKYKNGHHKRLLCVSAYAAIAHPVNHQMRSLIHNGTVGKVQHIVIQANFPSHAFNSKSIQFDYSCAGGAWEDLGPHAITLASFMLENAKDLNSDKPFLVMSAAATVSLFASNVDETMTTSLLYGDIQIDIEVSLVKAMDTSIEVKGTEGSLRQTQWYRAEMFNRLIHSKADGTTTVTEYHGIGRECGRTSWEYLLDQLVHSFQTFEAPALGSCEEEVRTMEVIDAVYQKSGLGKRCSNARPSF